MGAGQLQMQFRIDGRSVSQSEIDEVERKRAIHVLTQMRELGADVAGGENTALDQLDYQSANALLVRTKTSMGNTGILQLYREKLRESDETWRGISANSVLHQSMKPSIAEVEVEGLTLAELLAGALSAMSPNKPELFYPTNPEHFVIGPLPKRKFAVMETFGMHGEPVYAAFSGGLKDHEPVPRDPDTAFAMFASASLMSDGTPLKTLAMHQFKARPTGVGMKLGIFWASAAPDELVDGHKWHLAIEFAHFVRDAAAGRTRAKVALAKMALPILRLF